jgi:hypothetical protein
MFPIHKIKLSEINGILALGQIAVFLQTYAEQKYERTSVDPELPGTGERKVK